jgi:hypothetical protein
MFSSYNEYLLSEFSEDYWSDEVHHELQRPQKSILVINRVEKTLDDSIGIAGKCFADKHSHRTLPSSRVRGIADFFMSASKPPTPAPPVRFG